MSDLDRVLQAIARVETQSGVNNCPRYERSFAPKGFMATVQGHLLIGTGTNFTPVAQARWAKWGMATAFSYGPWQILYHTAADLGYIGEPWQLWSPDMSRNWVEAKIRALFKHGATTIAKIADGWNSGSFTDANIPGDYIIHVTEAFTSLGGDPNATLVI